MTFAAAYGILPAPERTGYTFKGWYTEENGAGGKIESTTVLEKAQDHVLYAYWRDETPPDAPLLQDNVTLTTDWTHTQDTIPLKLYDGVAVTELWVSVDNGAYTKIDGFPSGAAAYSYGVSEGEHIYRFQAKDAAGNVSSSSMAFEVMLDKTNPAIGNPTYENKITNFLNWIIGKTSLVIHVPVTDTGSGVKEIHYTLTPADGGASKQGTAQVRKDEAGNEEAEITFASDFKGTVKIDCTDAAGNAAPSITIGTDGTSGIIAEDRAPDIATDAKDSYYDTAPALTVTVTDDAGNAVTAGIKSVTYQVGDDAEKSVNISTSALQGKVTFTIPADEIPTGVTNIQIKASDNAGNETTKNITVKVKGPEKMPAAAINYRTEKLKDLIPEAEYLIDGTKYKADKEGCIPIENGWFGSQISIVKKGNGSETSDSSAQSLSVPQRPAAPGAPELNVRTDGSITVKTITNAHYRIDGGSWQSDTAFTGLAEKTIYTFDAYYPATDTAFASLPGAKAQIATMPKPPTPDKLLLNYTAETFTLLDGVEAFTEASCTNGVNAGDVTSYMGKTLYIRYPVSGTGGIIPASLTTPVQIPQRPATPNAGKADATYPGAADGKLTGLDAAYTYEIRVKGADGSFGAWKDAALTGTSSNGAEIGNLPAGTYEVRVKASAVNKNFKSEAAAVTIGETPAVKLTRPDIKIDYINEKLTGFVLDAQYSIQYTDRNGTSQSMDITAPDGTLALKPEWFGTAFSIVRKGNGKNLTDSDAQSLPIPTRPATPAPTGTDETGPNQKDGKLSGLNAGVTYQISTDNGATWRDASANADGEITGLAPASYTVRVKAGTSSFASEKSSAVGIADYKLTVTFMANGEIYREMPVSYGQTLTQIPSVPPKKDAGNQTFAGEWCSDEQGTPADFTNITNDMTVYAVYTTGYTVTLQGGTGYTLSALQGSASPVKEGGSFEFRFALAGGYEKTGSFAVKVNGIKVELTAEGNENGTYTITDIRENKTVTVEGVQKKVTPGGSTGGSDKEPDDKPPTGIPPADDNPSTESTPTGGNPPSGSTPQTDSNPPSDDSPLKDTAPAKDNPPGGTQPDNQPAGQNAASADGISEGTEKKEAGTDAAELSIGQGNIIVTVNNVDETACTAKVADAAAVARAVLTQEEYARVEQGETVEVRIDVERVEDVPEQDVELIGQGIESRKEEIPGLTMGMYIDISMFMRIGGGDWNAVHATGEPVEIIIDIPEALASLSADFYIIRAHDGEYLFLEDLDDEQTTITIRTEAFSTYAIAYQLKGAAEQNAKCGLCHICPTFLGICCFIWLAVIAAVVLLIVFILLRRKKEEETEEKQRR